MDTSIRFSSAVFISPVQRQKSAAGCITRPLERFVGRSRYAETASPTSFKKS